MVYGALDIAFVNVVGVVVLMFAFAVPGLFLSKWSEEYITAAST